MSDKVPDEYERSAAEEANIKLGNLPGGSTLLSNPKLGAEVLTTYEEKEKLIRENSDLESENRTDPLTGLPNGRALDEMLLGLEDNWQRSNEKGELSYGTFIAADLTHLKMANEAFGHDIGNRYLKEAAKILKDVLRQSDRVFRLGNTADEFIIHLGGQISKGELNNIEERINQSFETLQGEFRREYPNIDMSVSLASAGRDPGMNPIEAAHSALNKLSAAKRERERRTGERGGRVDVSD